MVALYGGQTLSQFLLNIGDKQSIIPFCIVSLLATLSVVPLAMTKAITPEMSEPSTLKLGRLYRTSPTGVIGSLISGLILSAIYGLMPLFLGHAKLPVSVIANLMATIILGGMILQYPIGRLSDKFERRLMMIGVCLLTIVASITFMIALHFHLKQLELLALFILGGATFTLYPLSISHACDHLNQEDIIAGTQGLLLIYSIGATLGPILAAFFMHSWLGTKGLIYYLIVLSVLLGWFLLWRKSTAPQTTQEEQQEYITVPHTTPVASELDPRSEEK